MTTAMIEAGPDAPAEAPPFQLVARDVVVRSLMNSSPLSGVIRADVASIRGRLFARWPAGGGWAYAELPPDADLGHRPDPAHPADFDLTGAAIVVDPWAHVARAVEHRGGPECWMPVSLETPADREMRAFVGQWPTVAGILGIDRVEPGIRLFGPGRIRRPRPRPSDPAAHAALDWTPFVVRHIGGDWGELGRFDETALAAAEVWTLGLQPAEFQSRHAVATGQGWVRSRYILAADPQSDRPGHRSTADIVTALLGGRPETLLTIGQVPEGRHGRA